MFGECKICLEKEKRIEELKAHIVLLQRLALPPSRKTLPVLELDQETGMIVQTGVKEMSAEEVDDIEREADAILNGTYE